MCNVLIFGKMDKFGYFALGYFDLDSSISLLNYFIFLIKV
jgi:hypothetical protein